MQPVVSSSIDGKARAEVAVGDEFTLSAAAEVPAGQGTIVAVEWDFDGTGRFPAAEEGVDGTAESGRYERHHSYDMPGTYFAIVRVTAHRQGDTSTPYLNIPNLAHVRVVVHCGICSVTPYYPEIGSAHVCTPVTNAHLGCHLP